jgi:hypothetical protein
MSCPPVLPTLAQCLSGSNREGWSVIGRSACGQFSTAAGEAPTQGAAGLGVDDLPPEGQHYETLRRAEFEARVPLQALPDEALEKWCLEQGRNGGSTVAKLHATMEGQLHGPADRKPGETL